MLLLLYNIRLSNYSTSAAHTADFKASPAGLRPSLRTWQRERAPQGRVETRTFSAGGLHYNNAGGAGGSLRRLTVTCICALGCITLNYRKLAAHCIFYFFYILSLFSGEMSRVWLPSVEQSKAEDEVRAVELLRPK